MANSPETKINYSLAPGSDAYQSFSTILSDASAILQGNPQLWWRQAYRYVLRQEDAIGALPPQVGQFIHAYAPAIRQALLDDRARGMSSNGDLSDADIYDRAIRVIHDVSHPFISSENGYAPTFLDVETKSIEDIIYASDRLRFTEYTTPRGNQVRAVQALSTVQNRWFTLPLPNSDKIMHKGGFPRIILKLCNDAPESTIEAEFPVNDYDVITWGKPQEAYADAYEVGIELDGVDVVDPNSFGTFLKNRDLDINQSLVGGDSFIFSTEAIWAARTGEITTSSRRNDLFGSDAFTVEGIRLLKGRAIMRLVKMVAEGKALSFQFMPANKQVDLSIYWLVLARKFAKKPNRAELFDKLFYLAQQTGQVREDEATVFDTLRRVHKQFPHFDINGVPLDIPGQVRWLQDKLLRRVDATFRRENKVFLRSGIKRAENDEIPYYISLEEYLPPQDGEGFSEEKWDEFINNCRERSALHNGITLFP